MSVRLNGTRAAAPAADVRGIEVPYFDRCVCGALWRRAGVDVWRTGEAEATCVPCGRRWAVSKVYAKRHLGGAT